MIHSLATCPHRHAAQAGRRRYAGDLTMRFSAILRMSSSDRAVAFVDGRSRMPCSPSISSAVNWQQSLQLGELQGEDSAALHAQSYLDPGSHSDESLLPGQLNRADMLELRERLGCTCDKGRAQHLCKICGEQVLD